MTEKQIPKLVGALVEHQSHFIGLSVEDGQWAIRNTPDAIVLCVKAIRDRERGNPEAFLDPLIRVDRTICPTYPEWMKEVMHPDLELTGPLEFNVAQLEQWLHPDQVNGLAGGKVIYEHLKKNDMLTSCLGLLDLVAVQQKGLIFFRQYFQSKTVFGWKSVVLNRYGALLVPCLVELGGEVFLYWRWLGYGWRAGNPALRFASPLV